MKNLNKREQYRVTLLREAVVMTKHRAEEVFGALQKKGWLNPRSKALFGRFDRVCKELEAATHEIDRLTLNFTEVDV